MVERSTRRGTTRAGAIVLVAAIALGVTSAMSATSHARGTPMQSDGSAAQADGPAPQTDGSGAPGSALLDPIGHSATVSGDGRFVAYTGVQPIGDSGEERTTVLLHDRAGGTTTELSPPPAEQRDGDTVHPVISADGCTVVATTEIAYDVFRDDDDGSRWDIYRTNLPHCGGVVGDWELVSTRSGPTAIARNDVVVDRASVSRGGTLIAYAHRADHLGDVEGVTAISVVDIAIPADDPARSRLAPGLPDTAPDTVYLHTGMDQPALSGDGRHLAFVSDAASAGAVPQWGNGPVAGAAATRQVFVWDRGQADPAAAVTLASAGPGGTPARTGATQPALSGDGSALAFTSTDQALVPGVSPACGGECPSQVFHLDRDADGDGVADDPALTLVSRNVGVEGIEAGGAPSGAPSMSADGRQVAFVSVASNLSVSPTAGGGAPGDGAVYVADVALGRLERTSERVLGNPPDAGFYARPSISDTGRTVVFDGAARTEAGPDAAAHARQVAVVSRPPTLSLADADLGTTIVGLPGDEWYVAVANDGPSAFVPATAAIDDPRFTIDHEQSTCTLGTAVPPGGDCTVRISFTPSAEGDFAGRLVVAEEGFDAVSVAGAVRGAGGEPALRADPAGADRGRTVVGNAAPEFHFDIVNVSVVPTEIGSVTLDGPHPADFVITTENCTGRPLNPGVACNVGVTFTPTDGGRRTVTLTASTVHGQHTSAVVAGDGVYEPKLAFTDPTVIAGGDLIAWGTGYPANTDVTVTIGPDADPVTIRTNERGRFIAPVPVPVHLGGGERTVVVESSVDVAASAPVVVVEQPRPMVGMPGFGLGIRRPDGRADAQVECASTNSAVYCS